MTTHDTVGLAAGEFINKVSDSLINGMLADAKAGRKPGMSVTQQSDEDKRIASALRVAWPFRVDGSFLPFEVDGKLRGIVNVRRDQDLVKYGLSRFFVLPLLAWDFYRAATFGKIPAKPTGHAQVVSVDNPRQLEKQERRVTITIVATGTKVRGILVPSSTLKGAWDVIGTEGVYNGKLIDIVSTTELTTELKKEIKDAMNALIDSKKDTIVAAISASKEKQKTRDEQVNDLFIDQAIKKLNLSEIERQTLYVEVVKRITKEYENFVPEADKKLKAKMTDELKKTDDVAKEQSLTRPVDDLVSEALLTLKSKYLAERRLLGMSDLPDDQATITLRQIIKAHLENLVQEQVKVYRALYDTGLSGDGRYSIRY